ncbi:MAG: hypothetical protein WBQ24_05705 [Xanthobacteraceae bacterium]
MNKSDTRAARAVSADLTAAPILSQIATPSEYVRRRNPESVTLLQQGVGIAAGGCIFSFAILAKPDLLANNPHR